ncbi:MAG: DNA primase [Prevotella sp.]|nr:DNA primase [Prevotella sp.]MBQ5605909.1 DNA primase [Prevotella sp.]MBQ8628188.1 DNA primase [Prevotella sp.]
MIDRATIERIKDAADIVDVVSEFVTLRKSGANYKGLCPFHNEKTPSFYVSPSRGICHCFSCGKSANPVSFIMEHEQMTYPEALRWLANKYHIEIREKELTDEERQEQNDRESMFIVNEWACGYFQDILHNDVDGKAIGMQYFRSRGFRDDVIKKFQLGFSPLSRTAMSDTAKKKGYKEEYLVKTGLCYKRENGELSDRYAGRVIFPWLGVSGKVCAFGGRLLDSRTKGVQQKYVNSPDSEIYHKERELYGIYQAKKAIAKEDCVYMVEGYTDVISMHQCGIENVVANSGTALSVHQIRILHRFTSNIILLYDGDDAGIHAAIRGTDMLLAEGMNVKVMLLPDGEDPDSFARKHTASEMREYIAQHQTDFIEFKTRLMLNGVTDPIKRSEAISSIVRSISVIQDQIVRATYLKDCAARLGMNEATLISSMNKFIRKDKEDKRKETEREQAKKTTETAEPLMPATPQQQASKVESMLIQMIVRYGDAVIYRNVETEDGSLIDINVAQYIDYDLSADSISFKNKLYARMLAEAVEHSSEPSFKAETYFLNHPDFEISNAASEMLADRFQLSKSNQMAQGEETLRNKTVHLILDYRLDYVEEKLKNLRIELGGASNDMEKMKSIMEEIKEMQNLRNVIAKELGNEIII